MRDTLDFIIYKTNNITLLWEEASKEGITPQSTAKKIDEAMLDWMRELTKTLRIWTDRGENMSNGELILARANIGALLESWLKFFYCVFNDNYQSNPKTDKNLKPIEPNNLSFETLQQYSRGILFQTNDNWDKWIENVKRKRNAIHAFNYRDIGNVSDFYNDIEELFKFIELIEIRLPSVEDYIQCFPQGYKQPSLFVEKSVPVKRVKRVLDF